jgi:hypothetical protein
VELALHRRAIMRNMRQAADLQRLRHLAGLVFRGLRLNHEQLLNEYVFCSMLFPLSFLPSFLPFFVCFVISLFLSLDLLLPACIL